MMTVLFVRPRPSPETIGLQHVMIVEPLELEVLGALTAPHRPLIVDMILEKLPLSHFINYYQPDVVCLTGYITHVRVIIDYCREAKRIRPAITTVVGGVHCEVCPEHFDHPSIDYRVVRNASVYFGQLLAHIHKNTGLPEGVLRKNEKISDVKLPEFDFTFPLPDRTLTSTYRSSYFYIFHDHVALMKTSFGCPHQCRFCFCKSITKGKFAVRSLDDVVGELQGIREKNVYIVDDDFFAGKERLVSFIDALDAANIRKRYLVYGRADFIAEHPAIIERFRNAGLKTVIVGLESFFDDELAQYDKGVDGSTNREAMRILRKLRVDCYATIIAPPQWSHEHFTECVSIVKSLGIHYVNIQPLTPLPGTGMTIPGGDLLLRSDDYEKWDLAHVSIRPSRMSTAEFYRHIIAAYDSVVLQPRMLAGYAVRYHPAQLWKMAKGSLRVRMQYKRKIRESLSRGLSCRKYY
jgi:radical SAM superfamily enzyme YgiQ (UPF0313 family)